MIKQISLLTTRNIKLFFREKGVFFASLITPLILLLLFVTFLGDVYKDTFVSSLFASGVISTNKFDLLDETVQSYIRGYVGANLLSCLLSTACITVSFCSNTIMVSDKVSGARKDLNMAPVRNSVLSLSYFLSSFFVTLIVCFTAMCACFIYMGATGWYLSVADVFLLLSDVVILTLFGTAFSSVIYIFLSSEGQISAVGTIISSTYGFICGAYMPISTFGSGLRKILSLLPGTYGTSLVKNHAMQGVLNEMLEAGYLNKPALDGIKSAFDMNIFFLDKTSGEPVSLGAMYAIMLSTVVVLISLYVLLNVLVTKGKIKPKFKNKAQNRAKTVAK